MLKLWPRRKFEKTNVHRIIFATITYDLPWKSTIVAKQRPFISMYSKYICSFNSSAREATEAFQFIVDLRP